MPRLQNISKYCVCARSGARLRRRSVGSIDTPCSGICWMPWTNVGCRQPGRVEHGRRRRRSRGGTGCGPRPSPRCRSASARSCRCASRPSARRPASSTGRACPSRAPSRPRSGCTPWACRSRRSASAMNSTVSSAAGAVEDDELVEAAVRRALGRGAVVADDHVDQRVVEDLEVGERVDQPADVVVGVLQEAGVDLHLAREDRLQVVRRLVPGRDLGRPRGQLGVLRDDAELLLARERLLAQRVPALVELALVLVRPLRPARGAGRGSRRARSRRRTACPASAPSAGGPSRSRGRSCPR